MRDQTDSKSDEWLCGCCGLRFKSRVLLKRHAKSHRDKTEIPDPGPDGRTFKNHYNTFFLDCSFLRLALFCLDFIE